MPETTRPATPRRSMSNEEPEIGFEASIPSDGDDPVGQKMIDDLGQGKPEKDEKAPEEPPPEPMPAQLPVS